MFNLQSIANNTAEQNARSKLAIQSSVTKQLNFTSSTQFESFKNSLNDSLKELNSATGSLFNADDLNQYLSNLSRFGVTNENTAKEQMKATIIGNKYLGVSVETQEMIFKYMKRTNNNDALNEHNKVVAGLLASSLDVSKEQLDALTKIAYQAEADLKALNMSDAAYANYEKANEVMGAALGIDDTSAQALQSLYTEFLSTGPTNTTKWAALLGADFKSLWEEGFNATSPQMSANNMLKFYQLLGKSQLLTQGTNGDDFTELNEAIGTGFLNDYSKITSTQISALKSLDFDKINASLAEGFNSIEKTNVEEYVQETTEISLLEKMQNDLSLFVNGIDWRLTTQLANTAFIVLAAGQFIKGMSSLVELGADLKKGGGLVKNLTSKLGAGSSMGKAVDGYENQLSLFNNGQSKVGGILGGIGAVGRRYFTCSWSSFNDSRCYRISSSC